MSHEDAVRWAMAMASEIPALGRFLHRVLNDRDLARVFLLHQEELFLRQSHSESGITVHIGISGLPLLSDPVLVLRSSLELMAGKYTMYAPAWPHEEIEERCKKLEDSAAERPLDALAIAILNTIKDNSALRDLITGDERVDRSRLRQTIKTYDTLDFTKTRNDWKAVGESLFGGRAGKNHRDIFLHIEAVSGIIDLDRFRLVLLERTITHWERILSLQGVTEEAWQHAVSRLHQDGLLEHLGSVCLWCNQCPETGVVASVATSYLRKRLSCPRCRRPAHFVASLLPVPALRRALELHDGLLEAAIAWWLTTHGIEFQPAYSTGGVELDLVIPVGAQHVIIECKMHELLSPTNLMGKLLSDRDQLRDHLLAAAKSGMRIRSAACVINIPIGVLQQASSSLPMEHDPTFCNAAARLMSYEEVVEWLTTAVLDGRTRI
jgi:hypothetical protein